MASNHAVHGHHEAGHGADHATDRTYIRVAIILSIITAVEVIIYYMPSVRPVICVKFLVRIRWLRAATSNRRRSGPRIAMHGPCSTAKGSETARDTRRFRDSAAAPARYWIAGRCRTCRYDQREVKETYQREPHE